MAITVVLAVTVGAVTLAFDGRLADPAPYGSFEADYDASGSGNGGLAYVNLTHTNGEVANGTALYAVDDAGNRVAWADVWSGGDTVATSEYVHVDGRGSDCALVEPTKGTTSRLVWADGGTEQVLRSYTVPTARRSPPRRTPADRYVPIRDRYGR